jgi:hypothetical protein
MAVKPVVYDDSTKKHRPLGSGEKMDGLSASSIISSQSGNLITTGSDGLAYATGSGIADPAADNLIEATPAGKLKVDMDRIIEWLDGHPSDAKDVASAINVVSADSGNVIIEGTDNGAYLSKAALSNAIGSMTDAQLQALAAAIADGQTIVASGGKLIVDPTNATAAKLKKITAVLPKAQGGIVADSSTGKLYVDFDAMSADTKRNIVLSMVDLDGGLAVHDSGAKKGTIYVDFTSMDPAIMRAVVLNMVQQGGGLAVDRNGQLYVDFTTMPDDKFQQLKDSLDMQRTLNSALYVYVDYDNSAASDTYKVRDSTGTLVVDVDRGKEDKPFKTVQGAVNMVTRLYALGSNSVYIYVKARRARTGKDSYYSQNVTLPGFTTTTGVIHVMAYDNANRPKLRNGSVAGNCLIVNGGTWYLHHLDCFEEVRDNANATGNTYPTCIATTANAEVHLRAVHASTQYYGTHPGKAGTFEITPLASKPQRVLIGSAVVFDSGAFPGWPANEERPIITDANGTTTFISCTWTAPTSTASGKLTIRYTFDAAENVTSATYPVTIDGTAQSSGMAISVASLETTYAISMRVLTCSLNGALHLDIDADGQNSIAGEVGNASYLEGFELTRGGYMQLSTGNTPPSGAYGSTIYAIPVTGNFRLFASVNSTSQMIIFGGGLYRPYFYPVGTVTGKRYVVQSAGGILAPRHASVSEGEALPGDVAGTVEDFTYSWYKEIEYSNN